MVTFVRPGGTVSLSTIFHEYTHFFASRNLRVLPPWLNEGLAEFYSSFESDGGDGASIVGKVAPGRLLTLRMGRAVPLAQMLRPDSAYRLIRDEQSAPVFNAQAWALVHYLLVGSGQRRGQLEAYMARLTEGRSLDQSFEAAFRTTYDGLQQELNSYVQRSQYMAAVLKRTGPSDESRMQVQPLTERDALQLPVV